MAGLMVSVVFSSFLGIGSVIEKSSMPSQALPLDASGESCAYDVPAGPPPTACSNWKDCYDSGLLKFFSVSYMWQPAIGCLVTVVFGMLFSFAYRKYRGPGALQPVKSKLIIPVMLTLWMKLCPKALNSVVSFDDGSSLDTLSGTGISKNFKSAWFSQI